MCDHVLIGIVRGLGHVIEAVALTDRDLVFRIAGTGGDEAVRQLRQRAEELGVADRVEWLGFIPYEEVPALLAEADIAVSPLHGIESFHISFPGKLLKYMAAGQLVFASDIEAHRNLIDDGENGVLYDGTTSGLVEALDRYVDDDETRRAVERAARETAERYNWDSIVARHERCSSARRLGRALASAPRKPPDASP